MNRTIRFFAATCFLVLFSSSLSCFLFFSSTAAQKFLPDVEPTLRFEYFGLDEGLQALGVSDIFQDKQGFLWLMTRKGLVRYDGYEMRNFSFKDTLQLSINHIPVEISPSHSGLEDRAGNIWTNTFGGFLKWERSTEQYSMYIPLNKDSTLLLDDFTREIHLDSLGFLWSSTFQHGIFRLNPYNPSDPESLDLEFIMDSNIPAPCKRVYEMLALGNRIYFATGCGLGVWDYTGQNYEIFALSEAPPPTPTNYFMAIALTPENEILVDSDGALFRFHPQEQLFTRYSRTEPGLKPPSDFITEIYFDHEGILWIGWASLPLKQPNRRHIFDRETKTFVSVKTKFPGYSGGFYGLRSAGAIFEDHSGMIWWGTGQGLFKWNPNNNYFRWIQHEPDDENTISDNTIYSIYCDQKHRTWLATSKGFNMISSDQRTITRFPHRPDAYLRAPYPTDLEIIEIDSMRIWMIAPGYIREYDPVGNRLNPVSLKLNGVDFSSVVIRKAIRARDSSLWITSFRKLFHIGKNLKTLQQYEIEDGLVFNLIEDRRGYIWLGSDSPYGCYRFDPRSEKFQDFGIDIRVNHITEDNSENLWVSGPNRFIEIDVDDLNLNTYHIEDYLPNASIAWGGIQASPDGMLWIGTDRGLVKFDPQKKTSENFFVKDGLPSNQFQFASAKDNRGEMFFATSRGLVTFYPGNYVPKNTVPPRLAFTGLEIFGKPVTVGGDSPLRQSLSLTSELLLSHRENDITIHFRALHFQNPVENRYSVQLENYDRDWRDLGTSRSAGYSNLDPGKYIFKVKAANSDGIWNEQGIALDIVIRPPWYWNWWSIALYLLVSMGIVLGVYRFQLNRRLALAEAARLRDLDELKTRFFTNISHEFRTPLTLIQGPAQDLLARYRQPDLREGLERIQNNSRRLLRLVNQLLDLSRLEARGMQLKAAQGDMVPFLRQIFAAFTSTAQARNIRYTFRTDSENLSGYFDKEILEKILLNLLSNAFKFTRDGGQIQLQVQKEEGIIRITVSDNGLGIPVDQLPHIFERFNQATSEDAARKREGSGVGLALAKELAELHYGTVSVESEVGKGTAFHLRLPLGKDHLKADEIVEAKAPTPVDLTLIGTIPQVENIITPADLLEGELPLLLIVEDNPDMRAYIRQDLDKHYRIAEAADGAKGLSFAIEQVPDVVVSDVMMPGMDGFELCEKLKTDERTSHIPVILLTAKADAASRIEGLQLGADAYLPKPFNKEELLVRLQKLIELRRKLQERYQSGHLFDPAKDAGLEKEDAFIRKFRKVIEENLSDPAFGTPLLCRKLGMSRAQLYRKVKALTDETVGGYILSVRLHKGRELLKTTGLNVSEVAYEVGFKDPAYFSRTFSEEFGVPPSEMR